MTQSTFSICSSLRSPLDGSQSIERIGLDEVLGLDVLSEEVSGRLKQSISTDSLFCSLSIKAEPIKPDAPEIAILLGTIGVGNLWRG
jgi:hypothetical protein